MDAHTLKRDFGDQTSFCGGIDAQFLLVRGQPAEVTEKVKEIKKLFPTGLIFSPSHESYYARYENPKTSMRCSQP